MASRNEYDIILMDIQLPDFDGVSATQKILHNNNLRRSIGAIPWNHTPNPALFGGKRTRSSLTNTTAMNRPATPAVGQFGSSRHDVLGENKRHSTKSLEHAMSNHHVVQVICMTSSVEPFQLKEYKRVGMRACLQKGCMVANGLAAVLKEDENVFVFVDQNNNISFPEL